MIQLMIQFSFVFYGLLKNIQELSQNNEFR